MSTACRNARQPQVPRRDELGGALETGHVQDGVPAGRTVACAEVPLTDAGGSPVATGRAGWYASGRKFRPADGDAG